MKMGNEHGSKVCQIKYKYLFCLGNLGMHDQLLALQWVQKNISGKEMGQGPHY